MVSKHKRLSCRYCEDDEVYTCITCNKVMNCRKITKCKMCGGIYCRPKYEPMSAGLLIIDLTTEEPFLLLVKENTGKINDPGGKVDSDRDKSHRYTVFREIKEELGLLISRSIHDLPYSDMRNKTYRSYVIIHTKKSPAFIKASNNPELTVVKLPVSDLLTGKQENISGRLKELLNHRVKNTPDRDPPTLRDYLKNISEYSESLEMLSSLKIE